MAKEFVWYGMTWDKVEKLSMEDFMRYIPARQRRTLKHGLSDVEKKLLKEVTANKPNIKTHCRDMVILPVFAGKQVKVHSGKEFVNVMIEKDMIGHRLGEFVMTRTKVAHSAPGIGATRSSSSMSVK
jgi:small subunit ribosomal protein S19